MADLPIQPTRTADRIIEMGEAARAWTNATKEELVFKLASLNLSDRIRVDNEVKLIRSVKAGVSRRGLELDKIRFSFARKGIFLERGVGKGRPAGSAAAEASKREWIRPTLEPALSQLADLLSGEYADIAAEEISINIPGIMQTKIQR